MTCVAPLTGRGTAVFQPTPRGPAPVFTNWAGNVNFAAGLFYEPESEAEVIHLVQLAAERNVGIRFVAGGHSWNSGIKVDSVAEDILISTRKLRKHSYNQNKLQLTVEPGVSVGDTIALYKHYKATLPFQVDCPDITIGGAVAVGAAGFSTLSAGYSDSVIGLEIITSAGEKAGEKKVLVKGVTPENEWNAAVVSVGLLGIVTRITLQLVPLTNVEIVDEFVKVTPTYDPLNDLEKLSRQNEGLQLYWFPLTTSVMIHKVNKSKAPPTLQAAATAAGSVLNHVGQQVMAGIGNVYGNEIDRHPELTPTVINAAVKGLPRKICYVIPSSDDVTFTSKQHPCVDIGCFVRGSVDDLSVARKAWTDAVELVNRYKEQGLFPVNFAMALRVLPPSGTLLQTPDPLAESTSSSSATGASISRQCRCHIQVLSFRQDLVWKQFSEELMKKWFSYGGTTPHWGKQLDGYDWLYPKVQATLGKNLQTFEHFRAQYDPKQLFLNQFWSKFLNIPITRKPNPPAISKDPRVFTEEQQAQYYTAADAIASDIQPSPFVAAIKTLISLFFLPLTLLASVSPLTRQAVDIVTSFLSRLSWRLGITPIPTYPQIVAVDGNLGVKSDQTPQVVDYFTADGLRLQLLHFARSESKSEPKFASSSSNPNARNMVVVMHGLTTSSDMFIMPEHINIVEYFLSQGYSDVFTVDNRISKRWYHNLEGHNFTLEHLIAYDNVSMIEKINEVSVAKYGQVHGLHIIAHCVNSLSIIGTAASGLIKPEYNVKSIIINSTGLTPNVGIVARLKMYLLPNFANQFFSYLSPKFIREDAWTIRKGMARFVSLFHWECEVPECHFTTFIWSIASKSVWEHDQLCRVTHERTGDLYGATSLRYDFHIRKMLTVGRMVKWSKDQNWFPQLPYDYFESALQGNLNTPVLMVTGRKNGVFYDSNIIMYNALQKAKKEGKNFIKSDYQLKIYEPYGHQDPFMGDRVHIDIFPSFLQFMTKHQ